MNRLLAVGLIALLVGCGGDDPTGPSDISTEEITVGTGAVAAAGDIVTVHYTLFLTNGTRIESSRDVNSPLTFQVGGGRYLAAFEAGVVGMRIGGTRRVTIPPSLAYGNQANGPIPANSTLRFDIELLAIQGK
jgi:FKBP-type peptidyl-prolyl cis-trans isomerase FkpA